MRDPSSVAPDDLRAIALYQKGILVCILLYLGAVVAALGLPDEVRLFLAIGALVVCVTATVFVFLLATRVYSTGIGVLFGILTMIPLIGLVVLLIINGQATHILKWHGIRVGLLGARSSDLP